ncbi:hypothetical protein MMC30_001924 [Trapelia coarctata]|nr:hypothetical protein [Trapelia coarctata]
MRDSAAFVFITLLARAVPAMAAAAPVQVLWTTDFGSNSQSYGYPTTFGPDGPWQAIDLSVGNVSISSGPGGSSFRGVHTPLYACGSSITQVLTPATGGNYSYNRSSTARIVPGTTWGNPDDWFASVAMNSTSLGTKVYDLVNLDLKLANIGSFSANATIFQATDYWAVQNPDGSNYTTEVGVLGLGSTGDTRQTGGIVEQMKAANVINSNSFGLHIGSAPLNVSGSLVLGGFDSSRALGQVGVFQYKSDLPVAILRDVKLGVEEGGSPFDPASTGSLYQGNNGSEQAISISQTFGAPKGTVVVIPNPAAPYIYLPLGTCEAIANFLPVTWNPKIGLYTWNTADTQYARIVNSPAYLEFILADMKATNISIKVPFKLLDLVLQAPLTDTPTPYFPCKPLNSSYGFYELGRAFLQAAFLGVNYEQNLTFLAQAPGPDTDQSVIQTIQPGDTNLTSNPIASFRNSWINHWTVLPTTSGSSKTPLASSPDTTSKLSTGAKAGIALGVLAVIALLLIGILFLLRRRKRRDILTQNAHQQRPLVPEMDVDNYGPNQPRGVQEMGGHHGASDLSKPLPHEMEALRA